MLLSKLQGGWKSPFLAYKWPENQIFMLSIVLHGIVWYCMELLCILWYRIVFMSFHCIVWYCIISYGIAWYCIVGFVSRKTPIYFISSFYEYENEYLYHSYGYTFINIFGILHISNSKLSKMIHNTTCDRESLEGNWSWYLFDIYRVFDHFPFLAPWLQS